MAKSSFNGGKTALLAGTEYIQAVVTAIKMKTWFREEVRERR